MALLEIDDLHTHFELDQGVVKAINGLSFKLEENMIVGIVGESGCGKSATARSILRILGPHGRIGKGRILFRAAGGSVTDIAALDAKSPELLRIRGKSIAMIFQEPMAAFSPVYTVGDQICEAITWHQKVSKREARSIATEALQKVGISSPERRFDQYPYQLSGGMLQRAMIAMCLSCRPSLLIADEPTTAIDVTSQAHILELMRRSRQESGMAILLISHNLGIIAEMADIVVVMYLGFAVEIAPVGELFSNPKHPYTKALFQSLPSMGGIRKGRLEVISGTVPDGYHTPSGCPFHPRCTFFEAGICDTELPPLSGENGHCYRCVRKGI